MKTEDFFFNLPSELIAQKPQAERGNDRLMVLRRTAGRIEHRMIDALPELLPQKSLLVLNDSRVRKARLYGRSRETNSAVEFLLVKPTGETEWEALCKKPGRKKEGAVFVFPEADGAPIEAELVKRVGRADRKTEDAAYNTVGLRFNRRIDDRYLDLHGHIPLPPYIKRADDGNDAARYQNVYARSHGSIAAPTAGLHLTTGLLAKIRERGIETAFITLHVGLGTFLPVRTHTIEEHTMHEERYSISETAADTIKCALSEKKPITAVGTTSLRCLEAAYADGNLRAGEHATSIFIYPGYTFKAVSHLLTNFHTPSSTLLMLVCALAGRDSIMDAYTQAVAERYRFFSYGDAMLIL